MNITNVEYIDNKIYLKMNIISTDFIVVSSNSSKKYELVIGIVFSSDMTVKIGEREVPAHKFVFATRSKTWNVRSLDDIECLGMSNL